MSLWRLVLPALLLGLGGCGADLLPDELVVPGELATSSYRGGQGASLGAGVALADGRLLAGAPGLGQAWQPQSGLTSQGPVGLGRWVWWEGDTPMAAIAGDGVYAVGTEQAELRWSTPGAMVFAHGLMHDGPRVVVATARGVQLWDDRGEQLGKLGLEGVQRVAVGLERVLLIACDGGACEALSWHPEDGGVVVLGPAGDGGAVAERQGVAWWGDPQLDEATAPGWVCSEEGDCVEGLEGDHLGRALSASHAAGVFNTWLVPARLRVVPLGEGPVLAVDRAAPSRPPVLHSQGGLLAIGLPSDGVHEQGEGRVLVVDLEG